MKKLVLTMIFGVCAALYDGCVTVHDYSGGDTDTLAITTFYGMKSIAGNTFLMGADSLSQTMGTVNSLGDTIHYVTLSDFSIDSTEVTQVEFRRLMKVNPSRFRDSSDWAMRPVENVTWYDAVLYCNARSTSEGRDTIYSYGTVTGAPGNGCLGLSDLAADFSMNGYRLPTEAEWEYACKGGTTTYYWWGNDTNGLGVSAWSYHNCNDTKPVATRRANAFGLYDMAGNVFEWCNDWYGSYSARAVIDPTGATSGRHRILRGSAWYYFDYRMRSTNRFNLNPDGRNSIFGFRCVRR
jgi:formylglycine-generating enzyme